METFTVEEKFEITPEMGKEFTNGLGDDEEEEDDING